MDKAAVILSVRRTCCYINDNVEIPLHNDYAFIKLYYEYYGELTNEHIFALYGGTLLTVKSGNTYTLSFDRITKVLTVHSNSPGSWSGLAVIN